MPKVSVIIPNYNHAPFLRQRIDSILKQTFTDFEIILLDDCSPDNSLEILKSYAQNHANIQLHINKKNSGSPFAQWNKGALLAKGEYLWIAESDDFCEPQLLEKLISPLENNPRIGISYAQTYLVDEKGEIMNSYEKNLNFIYKSDHWKEDFIIDGKEACKKWLLFSNPIPNASGALIRKSAFMEIGMADPLMKLNGDWYLYSKILSRYNLAFIATHLNYFRTHTETQRQRARATYKVYEEMLVLNDFIRKNVPHTNEDADLALKKISTWWTGSLTHQKWGKGTFKNNRKLYQAFKPFQKRLWFRVIYALSFEYTRKFLLLIGILKPFKKVRSFVFPGKYFDK